MAREDLEPVRHLYGFSIQESEECWKVRSGLKHEGDGILAESHRQGVAPAVGEAFLLGEIQKGICGIVLLWTGLALF